MRTRVTVAELAEALAIFARHDADEGVTFTGAGPSTYAVEPDRLSAGERARLADLGWAWKAGLYWTLDVASAVEMRDDEPDAPAPPNMDDYLTMWDGSPIRAMAVADDAPKPSHGDIVFDAKRFWRDIERFQQDNAAARGT